MEGHVGTTSRRYEAFTADPRSKTPVDSLALLDDRDSGKLGLLNDSCDELWCGTSQMLETGKLTFWYASVSDVNVCRNSFGADCGFSRARTSARPFDITFVNRFMTRFETALIVDGWSPWLCRRTTTLEVVNSDSKSASIPFSRLPYRSETLPLYSSGSESCTKLRSGLETHDDGCFCSVLNNSLSVGATPLLLTIVAVSSFTGANVESADFPADVPTGTMLHCMADRNRTGPDWAWYETVGRPRSWGTPSRRGREMVRTKPELVPIHSKPLSDSRHVMCCGVSATLAKSWPEMSTEASS